MKLGSFVSTPRLLGITFLSFLLAACAQGVWVKSGASTADFNTDKYTCEHDSMTATPNTPVATTIGVMDFNTRNRNQLFNDCMVSKGWSLQTSQNTSGNQIQPMADSDVGLRNLAKAVIANPRMKQAKSESSQCAKTYKEKYKEMAICTNDAYERAFTDVGYPWIGLIHKLNSTRSQLAAQLDAGKISEDYLKAKMQEKFASLKAEEIKRNEEKTLEAKP